MKELIEAIRKNRDVRGNLIEIRQRVKQPGEKETFLRLLSDTPELLDILSELLEHEDPKVRKNAALLLGDINAKEALSALYEAYEREQTLFIRGDYLKAMGQMDYQPVLGKLKNRLEEMKDQDVPEENLKHYREEMTQLQKLLLRVQPGKKHLFQGLEKRYDVLLTTNRNFQEVTARQLKGQRVSLVPLGVRVQQADLRQVFAIRTFRELLFLLNISSIGPDPSDAAGALAVSNLMGLLEQAHGVEHPFYFRITVVGKMPLDKRSAFIHKCSFALEQASRRRLLNSASNYEAELRLMERKDGTFLPLLKLYTLKDQRFVYRRESIAASIHPSDAALIAALTWPYLGEAAKVLDPFCGVGTMLIERDRAKNAGAMYGIDIFGEAISKARENTKLTGREIQYVNRDFFDFTREDYFDEIFTNMPVRGKKTKEEQEIFYQRFFEKVKEVLKKDGIMVLYSNEKGFIKKQLRLREEWKLLNEFCLNEKEDFSVFVIKLREREGDL